MRAMPFNKEAEQYVLSVLLNTPHKLAEVMYKITQNDFYLTVNKKIYNLIIILFTQNKPIEISSIVIEIGQENLNEFGGISYISDLYAANSSSRNIEYYINIILDTSKKRKLIKKLLEVTEKAYDLDSDYNTLICNIQGNLINTESKDDILTNQKLLGNTLDEIEKRYKNGGKISGIKTGINTLDVAINGIKEGELTVIAARPSMGKTLVALQIAEGLSDNGYKVALFEMEMTAESLGIRRLSSAALLDNNKIQKGKLSDEEWEKLAETSNKLMKKNNIYTDCSVENSIKDIYAKAKIIKERDGLNVIIIDHLSLLKTKRGERRDLEIAEITRTCKVIAKELNINVILLCQLNRANESRNEKRPFLSDIGESGRIEQDADLVVFVHREYYYSHNESQKDDIELIIAKNRNGKTGLLRLKYIAKYQRIFDIDDKKLMYIK